MASRYVVQVTWVALVSASLFPTATRASADEIGYRRDVLPLLSDRCFKCHGPDSASREAGLRLDQPEAATAELDSGAMAVVPGDVENSALVERIFSDDPDVVMPPADSGKSLSPAERELLRRWVESGAEYQPHWAFVAPMRPDVPAVSHADLVNNPIDAFVLARLEAEKMEPAPRASKERLIRRLYFDLTGLPPTLAEVDAFLADDAPDAYERLVDRLIDSPQYGEHMAVDWLDGARYADSNGYQNDFARSMWPWRDWVIKAFQDHMPYDQFITEQLAGDLLPNATLSQRVATGFNRNHRTVTEAGSIEEEWFVENVVDRVETTGTVMLGLTIGCARCHDHKFDPISQQDFYQLFGFFNNVNEKGVYTETRGNVPPLVKVTTPEQDQKLAELDGKLADLTKQVAERLAKIGPQRQAWIDSLANSADPSEPEAITSIDLRGDATARIAATVELAPDAESAPPEWQADLFGLTAIFDGMQHLAYSKLHSPPGDRPFSVSFWIKPTGEGVILSKTDAGAALRGVDVYLHADGKVGMSIISASPDNLLKLKTKQTLPPSKWSHVAATYDGSSKAAGVTLYVNGGKQEVDVESDKLAGSFANDQPLRIGRRATDAQLHARLADVQVFHHALSADEVTKVRRGSVERGLRSAKLDQMDDAQRQQFDDFLLEYDSDTVVRAAAEAKRALAKVQAERDSLDAQLPTAMVLEERSESRPIYLLKRGRYDLADTSTPLQRGVPAVLPDFPADAPRNRLGLARWLTSPENPLVARVAVNRLWQQFFRLGLVKTPDNFGVQAEPPSHPELLDWLATELVESRWNLQHIQRLIVMSSAYQQQSEASPESYQRDPENRLLARGPRGRLSAEELRDNALAVSGLLVNKVGGPSVMPYQPEGLWEELAGGAFEVYTQGHGDDLYRRSLYVYRKRTVPHPSMATFDAPSWEFCQVKRAYTDTPLQALALLNDVTYAEAARKFAERILREGGSSADARLNFAFRLATGRTPTEQELGRLRASLENYQVRFRRSPKSAEKLVSHGESLRDKALDVQELAAHTALASVLLNLDESLSTN
jgi:hypothetical protein